MSKFSLKLKILIATSLLSVLTGIPVVTYIYAMRPMTNDPHAEHDHLCRIVEVTRICIKKTQRLAKDFFSTSNAHSISWFIDTLENEVQFIDKELLAEMEQVMSDKVDHSPMYLDIIKRTHDLLVNLRGNVKLLISTLQNNRKPSSAMGLIKPLKDLQALVNPRIEQALVKFRELHARVMLYDRNLAGAVSNFMNEFYEGKDNNESNAALIKGLMKRVECSK